MSTEQPAADVVPDDETAAGGVDLWRLAGALAVFGAALIGAAILANRVTHPVILPADELAEQYREGWQKGRASILPELEAERARRATLEADLAHLRSMGLTVTPDPEPSPLEQLGETFGRVGAEQADTA